MRCKKRISTALTMFGGQIFAVAVLIAFAAAGTALAGSITKPFEFGPGLALLRSQLRTFAVPCGTRMVTSVTYARSGEAGANNDVPLFIEVRKPGATAEEDGPLAEAKENIKATRIPQTASFAGSTSNRGGCSIPWRVRVRHDADGPAPNKVSGSITVSFATPTSQIDVEGGLFGVKRGNSVTKNVGDSNGIGQGIVVITGNWKHAIGIDLQGPNAVRLKFQLIDPSGNLVNTDEGFSANELRDLPKLKLTYRLADCIPGQWKLKITNVDSNDDAGDIDPNVTFTPDCP